MTCECCPTAITGCIEAQPITQAPFQSVEVAANPSNHALANLPALIDGVTNSATLSGFSPPIPAGQHPNPATAIDFVLTSTANHVTELRVFNGGGGILNDRDGLGLIDVDFIDPNGAVIVTHAFDLTAPLANNAPTRVFQFAPVQNVARIRFRNMRKQDVTVAGTGSPLWREVQLFTTPPKQMATGMMCDGVFTWFDQNGNVVDAADVVDCDPCAEPFDAAEDVPWTIIADGSTATKIVNGVVITARITSPVDASHRFIAGCPQGACDTDALTVINPQNGQFIDFEFEVSDTQPTTTMRVIDVDWPGSIQERAYVFDQYASTPPDSITPLVVPGGLGGGLVRVVDGSGTYFRSAASGASNRSATLHWDLPWVAGVPLRMRFRTIGGSGNSGSQYDFGGVFTREACQ